MKDTTINSVDEQGRFIVYDPENTINICCDQSHPNYILTTSPTLVAKNSILYVQGTGEYHVYAGSTTRRRNMQSYLIMLTLSGEEILEYQNVLYKMSAGSFYWIDCNLPHYFQTVGTAQSRHAMWVHIYGATAEFYHRQFLRLNNASAVSELPENSPVVDYIRQLIHLYHGNSASVQRDIIASSLATSIAVCCIQAASAQDMNTAVPQTIKAIKSYLQLHYEEPITLDSLAVEFSVNKYHLQKQFKRYLGLSPCDYVTHLRITRAKELLRTTDHSVQQIAEAVGIHNTSNFARIFKKYENITPLTYRKHWIDPTILDWSTSQAVQS